MIGVMTVSSGVGRDNALSVVTDGKVAEHLVGGWPGLLCGRQALPVLT
jgi:hypothetical protein